MPKQVKLLDAQMLTQLLEVRYVGLGAVVPVGHCGAARAPLVVRHDPSSWHEFGDLFEVVRHPRAS